ncbi:DUF3305 domain-containing protein [Actibacterium lipolyticum]|uniref:DUF3305 domain-containing protein n=1 Tax=Actibacterium lipolyticum TaxID=1524263 RepID=A0A238KNF7_9RHOB|nr:DUF3305 domain-containing protein [Actibacterium lipolyticum]SMX44335.1 hypothetical protein COL8621_02530 [Actibacterium lipolyticum]
MALSHALMPLGIVIRRRPGVTRWAAWSWQAVAVLPGAGPADWKELRREGDTVEFHAATLPLELWSSDTEAYLAGLAARVPSIAVIMRPAEAAESEQPLVPVLVTASPYEAQDYQDSGEELVELVPMPEGLIAWVKEFAETHHVHEEFIKRKRNKHRVDMVEDGKGDPRIQQISDVYSVPRRAGRGRAQ